MVHEVLPTVKCSSCGQPVPLDNLGDHVCPPSLQKSTASTTTHFPQRLQSLVARSDARSPSEKPPDERERVLAPSRDPFHRPPPDIPIPVPFPKNSPPPVDPDRSQLPGAPTPPLRERVPTPVRDAIPPALQRTRITSNASRIAPTSPARAAFPIQFGEPPNHPVPRRPSPLSELSVRSNTPQPLTPGPPRSPFTDHASSNTTPPSTIYPRPSFERSRTPSTVSTSRPSLDKSHPSLDKLRPSIDAARRPSVGSQHSSRERNSSAVPNVPSARPHRGAAPSPVPGTVPFPSSAPVPPPSMSVRHPPPPPLSLVYFHAQGHGIDTKIGGEAGMAGVGRRGFEAAARAAMLAVSRSPHQPGRVTPLGDGQLANGPQYLETNGTFGHGMRVTPPPLSPNSAHTPSPVSPFPASPISLRNSTHTNGQYPSLPSPHDTILQPPSAPVSNDKSHPLLFSPSGVRIASPSRSPSPIPNPFERRLSGETTTQSPLPDASLPLPFFDVLRPELGLGNDSDDESVYTTHTDLKKDGTAPSSPSADSDVGLAYAQDSDNDTPVVMPLDIRKSSFKGGINGVKFPTSASSDERQRTGPSRQTSAASLRSAISSRSLATTFTGTPRARSASAATQSTIRTADALERAMETLIEEGASVSVLASGSVLASIPTPGRGSGKPSRSNTVPGPASPEQKAPKLPTRSYTNPSHPHIHSERVGLTGEVARIRNRGSAKRKDRVCARCSSKIDDGRWIQMDGGNILCERCWKNMYLPKCRRCNLPIEKQAVSSRDGQLKGKYHKGCFNCHTCQEPFPGKEFYVLDGKPFCAYHYHEANDSLCGASSCGQPIEGPCAVTHSGKRYHPEHLICEFEDGCKERLEEYWEVDGQMLCERHAAFIGGRDGGWTRGNDPVGDTETKRAPGADEGRMMKRMTRFIDLGAGGDDGLDIR